MSNNVRKMPATEAAHRSSAPTSDLEDTADLASVDLDRTQPLPCGNEIALQADSKEPSAFVDPYNHPFHDSSDQADTVKRRTLDDMRQLSDEIKAARKSP